MPDELQRIGHIGDQHRVFPQAITVSTELKSDLNARLVEFERNPEAGYAWDEVKAKLKNDSWRTARSFLAVQSEKSEKPMSGIRLRQILDKMAPYDAPTISRASVSIAASLCPAGRKVSASPYKSKLRFIDWRYTGS